MELKDRDLLCFSHDWRGNPLSKTHLMRLLARRNRVLWVNSIGYRSPSVTGSDLRRIARKFAAAMQPVVEVEPNLFVLNPLVIPAYGNPWVERFNRRWLRGQIHGAMKRLRFTRPMNWVFNPAAALVAGDLGEESIIYYCVDEYAALSGVDAHALARLEQKLITKADIVIVSSQQLYQAKSPNHPATILVRHGVDFNHFQKALKKETPLPRDIAAIKPPIIGYFGLISRDWVDVDLLIHLARSIPDASLVLLGKVAMDLTPLRAIRNVHLLGRKPYESLPSYCKTFDAAIIPFPITPLTLAANPLKAREYLAAGLPVVSTAIPEVAVLDHCRIASNPDEFVAHVREAIREKTPAEIRSESMRNESWENRLSQIEQALAARQSARNENQRQAA